VIAYTIQAARASGLFERVVVSTDSEQIAEVARRFGAEVPFLRDPSLADDFTPVSLATVDMLERLVPDDVACDVAQLMPNCPLRTEEDVCRSYEAFRRSGADSQLSMTDYGWQNPWWALRRAESGGLEPMFPDMITRRSQDLPEAFAPTGAIWWAKAHILRRHRTYHIPGRTGWVMPWLRAVDIDSEDDWRLTELLLGAHAG
jgi:N-acylneuraminate cytidylyltransferase